LKKIRKYQIKAAKIAPTRSPGRVVRLPGKSRASKSSLSASNAFNLTPRVAVEPIPPKHEPRDDFSTQSPQADALQLYMREIAQVKLLTPKEEIALARRIKRGDAEAREHMIKANLRLVVKIERDYANLGLPLLDLINEGNIGLIKGVERFNPAKGAKLSTYASWWIKQSIKRALANQSKTIRLPVHVVDKVFHMRRAEVKLREILDREPTDEEVAENLGLNARRVREYREASRAPVSLETPLGTDDDSHSIAEVVADTKAAAPFEELAKAGDTALVREVLASLTPRERTILAQRFGLDDDSPRTLEEIGQDFGVTRERIRQIQEEALKKLRIKIEKINRPATENILALAE